MRSIRREVRSAVWAGKEEGRRRTEAGGNEADEGETKRGLQGEKEESAKRTSEEQNEREKVTHRPEREDCELVSLGRALADNGRPVVGTDLGDILVEALNHRVVGG